MLQIPETGLIEVEWLKAHLNDPEVVVFDCRYNLQDPQKAANAYRAGHIPGAYRLDMETDLASPVKVHGGRHPLPNPDIFSARLRECGVTEDSYCVAYDDDGSGAARLWWLLRYFGHARVGVLNGGIASWTAKNLPLSTDIPPTREGSFMAQPGVLPTVSAEELREPHRWFLIDSRSPARYRGEQEPIDAKAGHIPGARLFNFQEVFEAPAKYLPTDTLQQYFSKVPQDASVAVYCGSGVTACVNLFALSQIGIQGVLYPGSWSDWVSYQDNPIATGDDTDKEE